MNWSQRHQMNFCSTSVKTFQTVSLLQSTVHSWLLLPFDRLHRNMKFPGAHDLPTVMRTSRNIFVASISPCITELLNPHSLWILHWFRSHSASFSEHLNYTKWTPSFPHFSVWFQIAKTALKIPCLTIGWKPRAVKSSHPTPRMLNPEMVAFTNTIGYIFQE